MGNVNHAIPLADTRIEVLSSDEVSWAPVQANATMVLSPTPRVIIEVGGRLYAFARDLYSPGGTATLRIPSGCAFEAYVAHVEIGENCSSLLVPTRQPSVVMQTGENIRAASLRDASVASHKYGYEDARALWLSARRDDL